MEPAAGLRERNLGVAFDAILDHDGDGAVTAEDVDQLAAGFCAILGFADDPKGEAIRAGFRTWWGQLSADCGQDRDGRITRAQFITTYASDAEAYDRHLSSLYGLIAGAMDLDGDGFIEHAEYALVFGRLAGLGDEGILAAFQRLDQDADGKISTQEFQAACAQFYTSQDPADPGTGLFGQA